MSVYFSVKISRRLLCNCSAYSYPHNPNKGKCAVTVPNTLDAIPNHIHKDMYRYLSIDTIDKLFKTSSVIENT